MIKNNMLAGAIIGVFVGMVIGNIVTRSLSEVVLHGNAALELCESNIPRSQRCKITAVPVIDEPPKKGYKL